MIHHVNSALEFFFDVFDGKKAEKYDILES